MSKPEEPDDTTRTESPDASVQDVGGAASSFDEEVVIEMDDRARSVLSLLIRKEGREVLERVLSTDDPAVQQARLGQLLLSSHDVLYTFSRLVTEGGLTASVGCLKTTALTDRILQAISENT